MKLLICVVFSMAALSGADKQVSKKSRPAPAKQTSAQPEVTLPSGANETAPGTYSYTDAQGRKWIYRKTPFGLAKFEDKPIPDITGAMPQNPDKPKESTKAIEDGDSIRFERSGPFGSYRWKRKKTELNETEQAIWDKQREQAKPAPDVAAKPE